ncbi:aminoglycoside phosphotransferase family protein, partial [Bacillus toyonensis]|uniref:aminoglycoside phosphotransferase family protein n=1 Tax=Bacillus toyonensis TaxID=155322 RepID=UPI002FFF3FD0
MEEIVREIERKLEWPCIVKCIAITKGFSHEEKYKIELENRETYFVKVCDSANYERKLEEYTYMKQIELLHIPTPKLIHFIKLEELNKCVQVFEWIDGVNGEESLRKLSVEEQYDVGRKAGEVLRRFHSIERESASNKWETFR